MYEFAGEIIDTLKSGGVLLVDEFNSGLHPQLCEYIINIFHEWYLEGRFKAVPSIDLSAFNSEDVDA